MTEQTSPVGAALGWHISPEKFITLKNDQGFSKLSCPDEAAVAAGQPAYWWEFGEVTGHKVIIPAAATEDGAGYPVNERKTLQCKITFPEESTWSDADGNDLGLSENAGSSHMEFMHVQPPGGLSGHEQMTEISLRKASQIVSCAAGIDEDTIDQIPTDESGNVDFAGIFTEENDLLDGGAIAVLFKKEQDAKAPGGINVEVVRCEPVE